MTTTHERASLLTVLLLAVSTASYAQTAEINPDWPDWIQKDMQRESGELRMDTFEAAEGAYRFQLPRRSKPLKGTEGFWGYTVEIGSDIPIACYLYSEDLPMTEIAVNIGEGAINEMLDRYEADEEGFRTLHYLDAGSIDGTVFLALEWLSRLDTDDGGVLVHTKIRAATDGGIVQVCWHSEPGYRETFENVFTTFVRSMQYSREVIEPFAADITVDTTNGTVTGATYTSLTTLENGDIESYSYTTSILPVAPGEIQYSDSYYMEYTNADGTLIDTRVYTVENGNTFMELVLEQDDNSDSGDWVVSGQFQGTDVEFGIPATDTLKSEVTILEETRQLFAGDDTMIETMVWAPYLDPTTFMPLTFTRDDEDVPFQGIVQLGPIQMTTVSDEYGSTVRGHMTIGPNSIGFERVWSHRLPQAGRN